MYVFNGNVCIRKNHFLGGPVIDKGGERVGPGDNYFSHSTNNVWVDTNGYLHLKIDQRNGTYYAAEIISQQSFGHGRYRFFVDGRIDNYDENIVAGLFTYDTEFLDPDSSTNEIDIEFTKAFTSNTNLAGKNAVFGSKPEVPSNYFHLHNSGYTLPANALTLHSFTWFTDKIDFKSQKTHDLWPAQSNLIAEFNYPGPHIPPISQGTEQVRLNLWIFQALNTTLVNTQNLELVFRDFHFTPLDDYDGDGLFDEDETWIYITDPNDSDTDGDGCNDGDEVNSETQPLGGKC
ncbi:MAG: hypothetical protein GKR87_15610 [Kiritimatiellae bacterium]|nr:hypothetical protein [Kiritimatiellia bacterium]